MRDTLINVDGVSKKFCRSLSRSLRYGLQDLGKEIRGLRHGGNGCLRPDEFWAISDVSFELKRGECLGLIGRNGAGKTTLLRVLNGLIKPDQGRIEMRGRVGALIALGAGFNPILTGRENIYVNASVLGLTKREIDRKIEEIIDFADIRPFIDSPAQNYSSGMQVRLGFAIATTLEPEILLLDEVLAVGDAGFRHKCYSRIGQLQRNAAVIFVSHSMEFVSHICDRVLYMRQGKPIIYSNVRDGIAAYLAENQEEGAGNAEKVRAFYAPVTDASLSLSSPTVKYQDQIEVCITLECLSALHRPRIGIAIRSEAGDVVAIWNTGMHGVSVEVPSGRSEIRFLVGPLYLIAGTYHVSVSIREEGNAEHLLWFHNQAQFCVTGGVQPTGGISVLLPYHGHVLRRITSSPDVAGL